ncbi:MAG: OB-fold nucleic acid binding domain-containing protein, partial [Candidatus Woesebacteria bacterium]|nr:OB-fold nucleic acid binding domain-containing protein [Candidatus Woesebacteria bacterium]
ASVITVSNIQEFSDTELESLERQLLGFSLSAKPISELIGPLMFQSTHKIFEITSAETYSEMVRVAGVVTEVRVITTRKTGAEMAFAKFDDGTGNLELVIFPKVFKASRDFWTEGQPLLIVGKVDSRDETPAILVESIETLSSLAQEKEREVFVKIPKDTDSNSLKRLKTLLTQNLGGQSGYLVFEGGKKIKLPFKIIWNETLAKQIAEILENKEH